MIRGHSVMHYFIPFIIFTENQHMLLNKSVVQ